MAPKNTLFLDSARCKVTSRRPVWMMRQAGRYLPEYQAVRKNYDFLTLCKTPSAAAEVSIQPYDILGVDAIIYFCDILIPCESMGMELLFTEGKGPQFPKPIRTAADIANLECPDAREATPFIAETISLIKQRIDNAVPVIGFAGAPWTLACYMIEGGGSRNYENIKAMMWSRPEDLHALLKKLTEALISYINLQVEGGASAIQIFDTWGGILSPDKWEEFSLPYITKLFDHIESKETVKTIYVKGGSPFLEKMIKRSGADVVSIDWITNMTTAQKMAAGRTAIQGNLDPTVLLTNPEVITHETNKVLRAYGDGPGLICNLGHGIFPQVPVENAKAFVDAVQAHKIS